VIEIIVVEEVTLPPGWIARLERAVRHVLTEELGAAARRCSVGLSIIGAEAMAELNATWRAEPSPTDVLSFPTDAPPGDPHGPPVALGDVMLAPECVAPGQGGDALDGLVLCAVHGTLHLLGHDHATVEEERAMFSLQEQYTAEVREL